MSTGSGEISPSVHQPVHRHTRYRRRRRRNRRRARIALAGFVLLLAAIVVLAATFDRGQSKQQPDLANGSLDADATEIDAHLLDAGVALVSPRPVYRYAVIPSGAYGPEELSNAMLHDAVVADHYRSVVPDTVRATVITDDRLVYVSYRKGDRIYWTKNKVWLRRGETILTDGTTEIRARCGNGISDEPGTPVSEAEPGPVELDRLVDDGQSPNTGTPLFAALGTSPVPNPMMPAAPGPPIPDARPSGPALSSLPFFVPTPGYRDPASGIDVSPVDPASEMPPQAGPTPIPPGVIDPWPGPGGDPLPPISGPPQGDANPPGSTPPQAGFNPAPPGLFDPFPSSPETPGSSVPDLDPFGPQAPPGTSQPNWPGDSVPSHEPINPVPVPEPGTIFLVGGGAAIAAFRKLRRRGSW